MRNAEFDREKVLRSSMSLFMEKGYSRTSMPDLTKATGLHPGSIYCAFENKRGLLLAAIGQYKTDRNVEFSHFFLTDDTILSQLKKYLDHMVTECVSGDPAKGCLFIKILYESTEEDKEVQAVIAENVYQWQQALVNKFKQAQVAKELSLDKNSEHLARFLIMGIYGLRTFAHSNPDQDTLQALAEQLFNSIRY
ncbi:MAG: TetR/AcrR family transcriptional repressor of nem operon [Colwellia sp.]|jgi:TetR/AcrR family transcriptional repressor of nem operon